uniref:Uncharacterized protein LOC105034305 isoform X2 n=1 Tax=Elaeis guineensis var. tenera TaxID=51953 RepID=A0A8N4EZE2_ELAGV|nr:uncharacterized protein LOC105034305 isoform X2 [Elaeis guineensis]
MGEERVKEEALEIIGVLQALPRLVVFDLDYTLWPFYCECCSKREMPFLYPHAMGILNALKDKGIDVAIASRSPTPDIAKTFLDKLGMRTMFVAQIQVLKLRIWALFGRVLEARFGAINFMKLRSIFVILTFSENLFNVRYLNLDILWIG